MKPKWLILYFLFSCSIIVKYSKCLTVMLEVMLNAWLFFPELFLLNVVVLYCVNLYIVLYPFEWLRNLLKVSRWQGFCFSLITGLSYCPIHSCWSLKCPTIYIHFFVNFVLLYRYRFFLIFCVKWCTGAIIPSIDDNDNMCVWKTHICCTTTLQFSVIHSCKSK